MKTNSASIKAIILTTALFLFIIFISLFKGVYLYNINIKNIHINSLFLKIDNKIVLKINGIKISNYKNSSKETYNLHKTVLTATKILNIFQNIDIKSINYGDLHINEINLREKNLYFVSPLLSFKAVVSLGSKNPFINFFYINIPKYNVILRDTVINLFFNKKNISAEGSGIYNKCRFFLKASLADNNILKTEIRFPEFKYADIHFKTKIANIDIKALEDLNSRTFKAEGSFKKSKISLQNFSVFLQNADFKIKNMKIRFFSKNIYIPDFKFLKNISIENAGIYYDINSNFLIINSPEISADYNKIHIKTDTDELVFKSENNFNFKTDKITLIGYKSKAVLNSGLLSVFDGDIFYSFRSSGFKNQFANLKSTEITGNLTDIHTSKIFGEVFSYKTLLRKIKADFKEKTLHADCAVINGIKISNINFKDKKLIFHSASLFNKNIKEILHRFLNTAIPVTQIAGENNITTVIAFNKNISFLTKIKTEFSLLKLFDFNISVPQGEINITENCLNFYTKNAKLYLQKDMPLKFTGTGLINFKKENLVMNGNVDFKINKIINLHKYKETAVIDFNSETLKTKNSSVFIDFEKKLLIINRLKNLIPYTAFKDFVTDGLLLITFSDTTDITTYLTLKLPILYKHSNLPIKNLSINMIKKLFLNISIDKNKTDIFNKNIDINVLNNKINVKLSNLDINLFPLEKLIMDSGNTEEYNYSIRLLANNSNLMYKTHKFLSQHATILYKNSNIQFNSVYKHSTVKGYTKQGYLLLEGTNFSNEEFTAFLPSFDFFSKINLDFVMVKSPENFYTGKIYINRAIVKELKSLNNIIAFINTIPSILSFSSPGFSSKGYKIRKGYINYLLYKKVLYIKDAKIYGDNLDFFAKGYVNFNKNYIFLKVTANMKMKLKKIPIIGKGLSYLLFGKDGSINIKMIVKGDINNPKVSEDIGKDILISPFTLFKRAITLPFNLF